MKQNHPLSTDTPKQQEEAFREQAPHYVVCFVNECPLKNECLHYLVGQYVSPQAEVHMSVNPHYPHVATTSCELFRPNEKTVMKKGMVHFYYDMPGHMEYDIRQHLIKVFGRTPYFQMRKGDRLITPEQQQQIADICRLHGWLGPLNYDSEEEGWLW